jgi:hypothetical protein
VYSNGLTVVGVGFGEGLFTYVGRDKVLVVVADLEVAAEEGHEGMDLGTSVWTVSGWESWIWINMRSTAYGLAVDFASNIRDSILKRPPVSVFVVSWHIGAGETATSKLTVIDHLHVPGHRRAFDLRGPVQIETLSNVQESQLFSIDSQTLRAELLSYNVQRLYELEVCRVDGLRCAENTVCGGFASSEWGAVFDIV